MLLTFIGAPLSQTIYGMILMNNIIKRVAEMPTNWPAMLMAMIDGIESDLPIPTPLDKNIYELKGDELASIPKVPGNLAESIDALEADHAFLTKGDVFAEELIQSWINWKRDEEIDPLALRLACPGRWI